MQRHLLVIQDSFSPGRSRLARAMWAELLRFREQALGVIGYSVGGFVLTAAGGLGNGRGLLS